MQLLPADVPESIAHRIIAPRPDCWIWTGATDRGYGRVGMNGVVKRVHRVVYEALIGPVPDGLELDHVCEVKACCNPDRLDLVTPEEHIQRTKSRREARPPRPHETHCRKGHEWTLENTRIRGDGTRRCRECAYEPEQRRPSRDRAR